MQAANARRPSATDSSQSSPRRPSQAPRPIMTNNLDSRGTNGQVASPVSPHATTPDALNFYKVRPSVADFAGTTPTAISTTHFGLDSLAMRSASGTPMSRLNTNQVVNATTRGQNSSFKDLVARFNQSNQTSDADPAATRLRYARSPSATAMPAGYRPHTSPRSPRSPRSLPPGRSSASRRPSRVSAQGPQNEGLDNDGMNPNSDTTVPPRSNHVTGTGMQIPRTPEQPRSQEQQPLRKQQGSPEQQSPSSERVRPDLLGDLTSSMSQWFRPGYNIPPLMQRTVSEGVMPHSNEASPSGRRTSEFQIGERLGANLFRQDNPVVRAESRIHQRSISDFSGTQAARIPLPPSTPVSPQSGSPATYDELSSSSPRSRIPVRSSSQNLLNVNPRSAKRTRSDITDTMGPPLVARPQRRSITPPGRFYSTRYEVSPTRPTVAGRRLKAIIHAPALKESPPLRSSRPRQHVSSARSVSPSMTREPPTPHDVLSPGASPKFTGNANDAIERRIEKENILTQLSNAVYQRPAPKLTLDVQSLPNTTSGEPTSGNTEFEEDASPSGEMPRSFPSPARVQNDPVGFHHLDHASPEGKAMNQERYPPEESETQPGQSEFDSADHSLYTQNVMDRIMELRERSSALLSGVLGSPVSPKSAQSGPEDGGTIEIMLSDTPVRDRQSGGWQSRDTRSPQTRSGTPSQVPTPIRGNSSMLLSSPRSASKAGLGRSTSRITLDSDSYSVINRVLDQYHETGVVSPEMVHTFQQHILETDPEMSARSDVDSLSIAKAALEDFVKDHPVKDHSYSSLLSGPSRSGSQSSFLKNLSQSDLFATAATRETFQSPVSRDKDLAESTSHKVATEPQAPNGLAHNQNFRGSLSHNHQSRSDFRLEATMRARQQSNVDPIVSSKQPSFEDEKDREDDIGPTPPPKDYVYPTPPKPDRAMSIDGPPSTDRNPRQFPPSNVHKRPLLPEIPSTGGGLGFLITPRASHESPPVQRQNHTPQPPSSPYNAISNSQSGVPRTGIRSRGYSATASIPPSDIARKSSAQPSVELLRSQKDTPASSIQQETSVGAEEFSIHSTSIETPALVVSASPDQRRLTKRRHTIKELVDTEFSFNQDMKVIEDIYKGTASAVEALSADDRRVLFGNSAQIVEFSESFLDTLKHAALSVYIMPRTNKWRIKRGSLSTSPSDQDEQPASVNTETTDDERDRKTFIGEAFGQHMVKMEKVYGDYLRNHDLANQRLGRLQNVPQVNLWLNECHTYASDITSAWDLDSLLVKPVQRITRYPLLLKSLLEETPADHPDYSALEIAVKQMMDVSFRINESKKRAELLDQVVNRPIRGRKDDVSTAISKVLRRRADNIKQNMGALDAFEDPEYKAISEKFGGQFFQLQVVMRDMEMYKKNTEEFIKQYNRFVEAIEEMIEVGHYTSPELVAKWRRFALAIREMTAIAYMDHEAAVRKHCIDPMSTLLKMHEAPQRLMQKRKKRIVEYSKYATMKTRGEKLDRKTQEQGEQFIALNETLKDELPKLFSLTAKLVQACLRNYIDIQAQWHASWQRKIKAVLREQNVPKSLSEIVETFHADFAYTEEQILSLNLCNGTTLAEASTLVSSSAATMVGTDDSSSTKRPSMLTTNSSISISGGDSQSPVLPPPDFAVKRRSNGSSHFAMASFNSSFTVPSFNSPRTSAENKRISQHSQHSQSSSRLPLPNSNASPQRRLRADSSVSLGASSRTPTATPPIPQRISSSQTISYGPYNPSSRSAAPSRGPDSRPPTANRTQSSAANARLSASSSKSASATATSAALARTSTSTLYSASLSGPPSSYQRSVPASPNPTTTRFSGVFNSALPLSDSPPPTSTPAMTTGGRSVNEAVVMVPTAAGQKEYRVLFLAASLFEFNIDRSRKEAGYPYLTYVPGEVFDVIGEKGELWLAKNQDDPVGLVGWIWEKHFAKLMPEAP